jgi:hypothetical protein
MAGSILYAQRNDDRVARHVMFGLQFALAATTAELRVCAGRHYRTDTWVGSLVGVGVSLAVPALHGIPLSRVRPTEWLSAGVAAASAIGASEIAMALGACDATSSPPASSPPAMSPPALSSMALAPSLPTASSAPQTRLQWSLLPEAPAGLMLSGEF